MIKQRAYRLKNSSKGYYLLEVLISFVIVSVGVLGLVSLHANVAKDISLNRQRIEAVTLTQDKIEQLRNFQVVSTTSGSNAYQDIVSSTSAETITGGNAVYSRSWTVTTNTSPNYKTITVTTSWTSQTNTSESVQLSTIVAENDPAASGHVFN